MAELVSVIVPVYNREKLVVETLDSIRGNTYRPIELVVVNDGSTDRTGDVLEEWGRRNRRDDFRINVVHKKNGGESSARNAGIAVATGRYITFLDSDDLFKPDMIASQLEALTSADAAYAYCMTEHVMPDGVVGSTIGSSFTDPVQAIPDHNWHVSALLIERAALAKAGLFREDLKMSEDWEFAARVKALAGKSVFNDRVLTSYRVHEGPQLVKQGRLAYAMARDRAIPLVYDLLAGMPADTSAARRKCIYLMLRNGLRFVAAGDFAGCGRCLKTVARWIFRHCADQN